MEYWLIGWDDNPPEHNYERSTNKQLFVNEKADQSNQKKDLYRAL